jgi:hypothetical protein
MRLLLSVIAFTINPLNPMNRPAAPLTAPGGSSDLEY